MSLGWTGPSPECSTTHLSQGIELRRDNEVIAMKTSNLVGPESHRHPTPFRQYGRMMAFFLGYRPNPISKIQGLRKIRKAKDPFQSLNSIALNQRPFGDQRSEFENLRL